MAVFGLQFPGGNDNYLTITGPSHPFLSGAEVSGGWRLWGAEGPGQRLGRTAGESAGGTATEASRASEATVGVGGVGTNGKRLSSENQGVEDTADLRKDSGSECEERMELSALVRVK